MLFRDILPHDYHRNEPPEPFERVHSEHVSSRSIGHERSKKSFLDESVDEHSVLQDSLSEERKSPGLANDHIGPLNDDNGGEEHRVASELEDLALRIRPLLAERIRHGLKSFNFIYRCEID